MSAVYIYIFILKRKRNQTKFFFFDVSLSCEYCQGREGSVLFGDDKNGYVLSYMFKIKDIQARGCNRWYSFIFLMTDRNYLVASSPFLIG